MGQTQTQTQTSGHDDPTEGISFSAARRALELEQKRLQNELLRVQIDTARFELERARGKVDTDTDTSARPCCQDCVYYAASETESPCDSCENFGGPDNNWKSRDPAKDPYSVTIPKAGE